ncbi:MAG TPA: fumarylacetoacetate hydrolase family protein [Gammaproteobacteria bacterium]|jgi:2-keto-4-pentenoate hydratase/2-oxohepta-3-ene-1,7-dioic acid hydratase in catechol pathway
MQRTLFLFAFAILSIPALVSAQMATSSAQPFKLGTFEVDGEARIGIVLGDELVIELDRANAALERNPAYPTVPMPTDMRELIGRYEYGMKLRLYEIVNDIVANNRMAANVRPSYAHAVGSVRILPPLIPGKMLNAAVNFYSHVNEGGTAEEQRTAAEERRRTRGIPYLFIKPTEGAVIGNGDSVVIPYGRDRIDWEVELGIVIGRTGKYISATDAPDHIFGYTVSLDISDRGGRPPDSRPGSDWLVGKGHDTFAPLGPWIVPKEFYGDPMQRLDQVLEVDGQIMQRAGPGDMIHSIYELVEYGSSIITLYPGDVVNNGTSGGTGAGRAYRGEQRFLQPGETIEASIDGIGTLMLPVVAEEPPKEGTGSRLPPVSSYRDD